MRFAFFVARRYLCARKGHAFISVISLISVLGVAIGVASLIVVMGVMNFAQSIMQSTLVLYATGEMGLTSVQYSITMSVAGAGAVLGGLLGPVLDKGVGFPRIMWVAVAVVVPLIAAILVWRSWWVLLVALFLNSLCGLLVSVMVATIRQRVVPIDLSGRVASLQSFVVLGLALPLGALASGLIAAWFGLRAVFLVSLVICAGLAVATVPVLAPRRLSASLDQLVAEA